jgi:hypothetical protein
MSPRSGRNLRNVALLAAASLDSAVRTRATGMSRQSLIVAGLLAAGGITALAQLVGADLRGGLAGAQPTLLSSLLAPRDGS